MIKRSLKIDNKGQTAVEYLLIMTFLVVIFTFMYKYMGVYLKDAFFTAAGMILKVYS
jgi:Flp pilus assembly pilin Flp